MVKVRLVVYARLIHIFEKSFDTCKQADIYIHTFKNSTNDLVKVKTYMVTIER